MWSCFLQGASETQTALESVISGPLLKPCLPTCLQTRLRSAISGLVFESFLFPKAINTPPKDNLQGPPEPAKTQRKPQRPTPALPLGRHRRSHTDFNLILLTVAWFGKVASPKPSYCQQFHPKPQLSPEFWRPRVSKTNATAQFQHHFADNCTLFEGRIAKTIILSTISSKTLALA